MPEDENFIIRGSKKLMISDDVVIQAIQDIFKEEIKDTLKKKLKENPRLEKELKDAIKDYTRSKLLEASAQGKLLKVVAELGMISMPESFKDEMVKAVLKSLGPELDVLLKNTL